MIQIQNSDLDQLERRLQVAQAVVWQAVSALEEYGAPTDAAGLAYSFEELRDELERHRQEQSYEPG